MRTFELIMKFLTVSVLIIGYGIIFYRRMDKPINANDVYIVGMFIILMLLFK